MLSCDRTLKRNSFTCFIPVKIILTEPRRALKSMLVPSLAQVTFYTIERTSSLRAKCVEGEHV